MCFRVRPLPPEIAPRLLIRHSEYTAAAFTGQVSLNFSDYFALTSTFRVAPVSRTGTALFGGARLGALPGTIAGIGVPLAVLALIVAVCGNGGCFGD
jgi:hypothetical protein